MILYYFDMWRGYYVRHVRRLQWQSRYYILPAYRRLMERHGWRRTRWIEFGVSNSRRPVWLRNRSIAAALLALLMIGVLSSIQGQQATPASPAAPPHAQSTQRQVEPIASPHSQTTSPAVQATSTTDKILFGLGAQADGAMTQKLYREANVGMLTSWFNGPDDLKFMSAWRNTTVQQAYVNGKAMHLIVWTGGPEKQIRTSYGPACGRNYPFSASFEDDMRQLAEIFAGRRDGPPLYVSMFTEFQTYPCQDNNWRGSENYYRGLQDRYLKAQDIFHAHAPNSQVSLTWGGWQADWDDPAKGGGKSLIPHFSEAMNRSEFQSFQAMDSRSNRRHMADMSRILGSYGPGGGKKVMVAHFKPDSGSQTVWSQDLSAIFEEPFIAQLKRNGLFAFSFMDETNINASSQSYNQTRDIIQEFGR